MAAVGGLARNDSTIVTAWPPAFDTENDIYVNGKADTFKRQLNSALQTRQILTALIERPLSMADLIDAYPDASMEEITSTLDIHATNRQLLLNQAAAHLPNCIKMQSLTISEQKEINDLAIANDGMAIYEIIMRLTDLTVGRAQDRIRAKFNSIVVKPTDSIESVIQMVDTLWYLFENNTLYDHSNEASQREGIRLVLAKLVSGPDKISTEASMTITTVDTLTLPPKGAREWISQRLEVYKRYGKNFVPGGDGEAQRTRQTSRESPHGE